MTLPSPIPPGTDPDLDKALEVLGAPVQAALAAVRGLTSGRRATLLRSVRASGTVLGNERR